LFFVRAGSKYPRKTKSNRVKARKILDRLAVPKASVVAAPFCRALLARSRGLLPRWTFFQALDRRLPDRRLLLRVLRIFHQARGAARFFPHSLLPA